MITVGTINGSFGTRGLIKIKSFCEPAESIKIYDPIYIEGILEPAELKFLNRHKTSLTASVSGITNKEITKKLIGKKLLIKRQSLPELEEDEFYHSDLLQCEIFTQDLQIVGPMISVQNYGAGDIIEFLVVKKNKKIMVPLNRNFIKRIEIKEKKLIIHENIIDS